MAIARTVLRTLIALGTVVPLSLSLAEPAVATPPPASTTSFHAWSGPGLVEGRFDGVKSVVNHGRQALALAPGHSQGSWTSPLYAPGVPIGDLVSSWQAETPAGSWLEVRLQVQVAGHASGWYIMGRWASENTPNFTRTSVNDQSDADGKIDTDTYYPGVNGSPSAYRLQVVLHGDGQARPLVYQLAATTSSLADPPPTSTTTMTHTIDLPVPELSQETHAGEFPAAGGGGEVWCSPTSTAMVLEYLHKGPTAAQLASLPADPVFDQNGRRDGVVDYAAQGTYDPGYEGTGNWPFNTAYASSFGLDGSVRQLSTLRDIEVWIKRGVPVVISIAWDNANTDPNRHLDGAPIPASRGHLMVVRGFTGDGQVIVNDPAAPDNASVHHVYQRSQFERRWLDSAHGGSGTVYLIKPLWLPS
ncbi:MAG TPA: peptidase C39 family protein [Candidatus Saccharimonadia bacterium]|nr:peptidase C39 family protein [Candidatus Saccharimonadia bacterium]